MQQFNITILDDDGNELSKLSLPGAKFLFSVGEVDHEEVDPKNTESLTQVAEVLRLAGLTSESEKLNQGIQLILPKLVPFLARAETQTDLVNLGLQGIMKTLKNKIREEIKNETSTPEHNSDSSSPDNSDDRREEKQEVIRWGGARERFLSPLKVEKAPITIEIKSRKAKHIFFTPTRDTDGTFTVGFKKNDDGEYILVPETETHAGDGNGATTSFWKRHRKKKPTHAMVYARDYSARSAIFELEI